MKVIFFYFRLGYHAMKAISLLVWCHKSEKCAAPHLYHRCVCGPVSDKTSLRNARSDRMKSRASTPRQLNTSLLTIWTGSAVFSCHSGQGRINKVCWQHCFWQSRFAVLSGTDCEPLLCSWSNFDLQGLWEQERMNSDSSVSLKALQHTSTPWLVLSRLFHMSGCKKSGVIDC